MKMRPAICIVIGVFLLSGCLRSLHPLYTEKDLVFDPNLIGTWIEKDGKTAWTFEKGGEKSYELVYSKLERREGQIVHRDTARFRAYVVKLGRYRFLDITPLRINVTNDLLATHLVPAHTFSRLWLESDRLRLAMLDHDWVKKMIESGKLKVQYERIDEGQIILTAPTKAIQKLVTTYAENREAFPGSNDLTREK